MQQQSGTYSRIFIVHVSNRGENPSEIASAATLGHFCAQALIAPLDKRIP
ncbi:Hypothetical protein RY69_273 [Bifidobacterium breve]|nr:Hypothetical protein RY69_273 [Bifidobacterium breve]BAJ68105.1 hypothetical protein BLIJ_0511 [Bifidobacterium longum subsp. infantis ATCC 15697 = JCM 1222 = DSM 20088]